MSEEIQKKVVILPTAIQHMDDIKAMEGEADYLSTPPLSRDGCSRLLAFLRGKACREMVIFSTDLTTQEKLLIVDLMGVLSRAESCSIRDLAGRRRRIGWHRVLLEDGPLLLAEYAAGVINLLRTRRLARRWLKSGRRHSRRIASSSLDGQPIAYLRSNMEFNLRGGGSVAHTAGVIHGFQRKGFPVYYLGSGAMPLIDSDETPTWLFPPSRLNNFSNIFRPLSYGRYFRKRAMPVLKSIQPAILYHRCTIGSLVQPPLADATQSLAILEFNSSEIFMHKHTASSGGGPLHKLLNRALLDIEEANLRAADLVVTVSDVMRDQLLERGIDEHRVITNPNGVDPDRFDPSWNSPSRDAMRQKYCLPQDKKIITFIGTFGFWHGTNVLAEAVKPAISLDSDQHFLTVGTGALASQFQERIQKIGMGKHVTMLDAVKPEQIPEILYLSDILVSPHIPNPDGSRFFGSPTKLFEYMASGRPIVASRLEQIGEILEDDKTAVLVPPSDAKLLVEAIASLSRDEKRQRRLGEAAREEVMKRYTWDHHVGRIVQAIETIVANHCCPIKLD